MIFFTTQAQHLDRLITLPHGVHTVKKFTDGELYVRVEEDVRDKFVWVIASTLPPAESMIELFFTLDALCVAGARVRLLLTYFGYGRQDRPAHGEAHAAEVIARCLNTFPLVSTFIIHAHSKRLQELMAFQNVIFCDLFCTPIGSYDLIASPDEGAYQFAVELAKACGSTAIMIKKARPEQELVRIVEVGDVFEGKRVLIVDDIISTGATILTVAKALKQRGAHSVSVAATHGVFSDGARMLIEQSSLIDHVYVTNTLMQEETWRKITVLDCAPYIQRLILEHSHES